MKVLFGSIYQLLQGNIYEQTENIQLDYIHIYVAETHCYGLEQIDIWARVRKCDKLGQVSYTNSE